MTDTKNIHSVYKLYMWGRWDHLQVQGVINTLMERPTPEMLEIFSITYFFDNVSRTLALENILFSFQNT